MMSILWTVERSEKDCSAGITGVIRGQSHKRGFWRSPEVRGLGFLMRLCNSILPERKKVFFTLSCCKVIDAS